MRKSAIIFQTEYLLFFMMRISELKLHERRNGPRERYRWHRGRFSINNAEGKKGQERSSRLQVTNGDQGTRGCFSRTRKRAMLYRGVLKCTEVYRRMRGMAIDPGNKHRTTPVVIDE